MRTISKLVIGVDYGIVGGDQSTFVVAKKEDGKITIIDIGNTEDFDYSKYVATEHQVVGEKRDLEMFKKQFIKVAL